MKRELLERSIVLDATDRDGLLAELRGLGIAPAIDPTGARPGAPTRATRPSP